VERAGIGRAIVAQRVSDLLLQGLLVEPGSGPSTGGRPPRRLQFNSEAGWVLAADLGATSVDVAIADLSAGIAVHVAEPADIADGPEVILGRVEALFDELLVGRPGSPVWGIGIGVPGPVEFSSGRPSAPPIMPGWDGYPIRGRFERRYDVPVWVDNDVNIMALGEWRMGVARGHSNVVFVKIGTGIGAGLISDNVLHRGAQGAAGDVGHVQLGDDRSITCRCGNVGCLEALAGGQALARDGELLARAGKSPRLADILRRDGRLTAESVGEAARHGDAASVNLIQRAGRLTGGMLATVVSLLNPSLVVIGGGVSAIGDGHLAAIRETVYRRSLPLATRDLQILPARLGGRAGVIGAALMVVDELLARGDASSPLAVGMKPVQGVPVPAA
jgi:glucokinase-like ROK family protein